MDTQTLLQIFLSGAGLQRTGADDALCIGTMLPCDCKSALEKVMRYHTRIIDELLEVPHQSTLQTIVLLSMRGVTFHEYRTVLFDTTIHHKDFGSYPPLRCLFFSSDKERREKILYALKKDSHADYLKLLGKMLQNTHPLLFSFVFSHEG